MQAIFRVGPKKVRALVSQSTVKSVNGVSGVGLP